MTVQAPNWNETKLDPMDLARQCDAQLSDMATKFNANPTKFMKDMKMGGGLFNELTNPAGQAPEDKADSAGSQYFPMMGKAKSKKDARLQQLLSDSNAIGLPKTYREKKDDYKQWQRITSGRGKGSKDPFAAGGDKALGKEQQMEQKSKFVTPQLLRSNAHMAASLGGGNLYNTMQDSYREEVNPATYRVLNNAADGHDMLKSAARNVSEEVKTDFVTKKGDVDGMARAMEIKDDIREKITSPEPETTRILSRAADGDELKKNQARQISDAIKEDFVAQRDTSGQVADALELNDESKARVAAKPDTKAPNPFAPPNPFAAPTPPGYKST